MVWVLGMIVKGLLSLHFLENPKDVKENVDNFLNHVIFFYVLPHNMKTFPLKAFKN